VVAKASEAGIGDVNESIETVQPAALTEKAAAHTIALIAATLLCLSSPVDAHDLWIEPSTFHPAPGATVAIGLRVGQNFIGDAVPRSSRSIAQFVARQADGEQRIGGMENIDPAGWIRAEGHSTALIAYSSLGSFIELPAAKFEDYLRQEGLDRVIDIRTARGEREKPGGEYFYRYAKALLTGERAFATAAQPIGLTYEIVPDDDPTLRFRPFRGRVLYAGESFAEARVVAILRSDPSVRLTTRSDERGGFSFDLPQAGVWLIKSVHMVRASIFSRADWDSLWASLTFEAPEPNRPPGPQSSR
jgi:hypothetical protein